MFASKNSAAQRVLREYKMQEKPRLEEKFAMRLGGIDEVLSGKGTPVQSYEDIYCSSRTNELIFVPKVVGVSLELSLPEGIADLAYDPDSELTKGFAGAKESMYNTLQALIISKTGRRDEVHPELMCLVYDPEATPIQLLEQTTQKRDALRRIKLASYKQTPNLSMRPYMDASRASKALKMLESGEKNERARAKTIIEHEREMLEAVKKDYGLTRMEATNYDSLVSLINHLNGTPDVRVSALAMKAAELMMPLGKVISALGDLGKKK